MDMEMITRAAYDTDMARHERNYKRLWIITIIITLALIGTNAAWMIRESNFADEITFTQEAESDGEVILNGSGTGAVYYYGEGKADNNNKKSPQDGR